MITVYPTGDALIEANRDDLDTNPYLSIFFYLDAPALKQTDSTNFALKAEKKGKVLLSAKVEPYSTLLFGEAEAAEELVDFWEANGYRIGSLLGSETLCDTFVEIYRTKYGISYYEALAMDFMECSTVTEPSAQDVEIPTEDDCAEIVECMQGFVRDCNLNDPVNPEHIRASLADYRILRKDGTIAVIAKIVPATPKALKLTSVYTRPEYRGLGLARQVVNAAKNEILSRGMIATLNVDKRNPVTNHLYRALGFVPVFSQGEYRRQ